MKHAVRGSIWSGKGFTVVELLVIVVVMGVLVAIGLPSFLQWRQTLEYRSTARDIVSILRNAQSRTITTNLQHRIEFETPALRRYRMTQGNFAANSSAWPPAVCLPGCVVIQDWTNIPAAVFLNTANLNGNVGPPANNSINFNNDSTARIGGIPPAPAIITVQDNTGTIRFTINVTQVGRVSIRTGP